MMKMLLMDMAAKDDAAIVIEMMTTWESWSWWVWLVLMIILKMLYPDYENDDTQDIVE